jgi:aspartate aminotransferase-like enzyme
MSEQHGELGALIIKGLEEALAHMRGEGPDLRTVRYERLANGTIERVETYGGETTREIAHPRADWGAAYQRMAERGDDELLDDEVKNSWDQEEWEWPEDE